jgi:hypothetical protein
VLLASGSEDEGRRGNGIRAGEGGCLQMFAVCLRGGKGKGKNESARGSSLARAAGERNVGWQARSGRVGETRSYTLCRHRRAMIGLI